MCPPISLPLRNARFLAATHIGYSPQARHKVNCPKGKRGSPGGYQCRATRKRVMIDSTYEDKLYQTSKFVGAVRYNVPRICAALSCRALR